MSGLKIIPAFLILIVFTYLGLQFVEANREEVVISLGDWNSSPAAIGFVILTSALIGMLFCGALCSIEILGLYVQNRRLRRKLETYKSTARLESNSSAPASDIATRTSSGRFT